MKINGDHGLKSVQAFGWGDYATDVMLMFKDPAAKYYLIVTDINGNDVSIEIAKPEGVELKADVNTGFKSADQIKIPVAALEVEVPGVPSVELIGPCEATVSLAKQGDKAVPAKPSTKYREEFGFKPFAPIDFDPKPPKPGYKPPKQKPHNPMGPQYEPKPGANSYLGQPIKSKVYYDEMHTSWVRETFNEVTGEATKDWCTDSDMRRGDVPFWLRFRGKR